MEEKRESNPLLSLCAVLMVLLLSMIVLSVMMWTGKSKAEKEATEYKTSYENLLEENKEAERAAKEEKEKAEQKEKEIAKQKADDYQVAYNTLVSYMLDDAVSAESIGNLIVKVWHNAIWSTADEETDKFTKKDGKFVTDFNDALRALFVDADFSKKCSDLAANQMRIKNEMKNMLTPPEGYENAFKALENMYNSYITFTNIVLDCNGSLESFSNDFGEADEDLIQKYHSAELYVK